MVEIVDKMQFMLFAQCYSSYFHHPRLIRRKFAVDVSMHPHAAGSKMNDGVERAISSSSSFISASMLAKRGVLKYLSPVSGNIATMTEPTGAFLAVSTAAHTIKGSQLDVLLYTKLERPETY